MVLYIMGTARCAADPTLSLIPNQQYRADVPVYIKDTWTDHRTGESRSVEDHFRCVFWGANATRADQLLMKGSQLIITSGKLRTYTHRDGRVFTQLWVDRWEVPTKVMMTKALYYEVFQSELLPYQVFLVPQTESTYLLELYVDKRRIGDFAKGYDQQTARIEVQIKSSQQVLAQSFLDKHQLKRSTPLSDGYAIEISLSDSPEAIELIESVHTKLMIAGEIAIEHTFPLTTCLHQAAPDLKEPSDDSSQ